MNPSLDSFSISLSISVSLVLPIEIFDNPQRFLMVLKGFYNYSLDLRNTLVA